MQTTTKVPTGFKVIIGFHLLSIVVWTIGQGGTLVAYDTVASWGLQDPRALIDPAIVEVNRGIGLADMLIMIPLFAVAVVGLWRGKKYGAIASWLVLGITFYWPVVALASQFFYRHAGITHHPMPLSTYLILGTVLLFAAWATWYLARNYDTFGDRLAAD